jgi:2-polyprenyl-3-methyl-5-hydroxy-6-metoxy-1,4-benzoquinol methylase
VNAKKYVYDISGAHTEQGIVGFRHSLDLDNSGIVWDMILCNQVMEHLSDVRDYFSNLVSYMSDNTYLYIEVPNERSVLNSYTVKIHEHINMFSEKSFYKLAEDYNLKVLKSTDESGISCLLKKR